MLHVNEIIKSTGMCNNDYNNDVESINQMNFINLSLFGVIFSLLKANS